MRRPSTSLAGSFVALAATFGLLLQGIPRQGSLASQSSPPLLGAPFEKELQAGTVDSYRVVLAAGDYLHAVVEQRGVDVIAAVFDPTGRQLLQVDSPTGKEGPEPLFLVAAMPGAYRLEVRPLAPQSRGRYGLRIEELRPASSADRLRARAASDVAGAEALRAQGGAGSLRRALAAYRAALRGWQALGARSEQAAVWRRIGQVEYALADLRGARAAFETALGLCRDLGDDKAEAPLLNDAGAVYQSLSQPGRAEAAFRRARDLFRAEQDRRGEAASLNLLGGLYASRADLQSALDAYRQALSTWRALGDRSREAATLHDFGTTYSLLGRMPESLELLRQALLLRRAAGDRRGEASTLIEIGWAQYLSGDPGAALPLYDQSLAISRREGNLLAEAAALDRRGTALMRLGAIEKALASYRRALSIFERAGQPGSMAHTLANLGWLHEARGDPRTAALNEDRALRLFRSLGDRHAEAHTLLALARAERAQGHLALARERIVEALDIAESLRGEAPIQAMRTSYLATRHVYYEFAVDLLMQMGLATQAWEVSERARARSLLESVAGRKSAPAIDEDLRKLVFDGGLGSRLLDGAGAAPTASPLPLREIQQRVLDPDTLLLQYALGEERSFLWVIDAASIESCVLPGRRKIEDLARRAYGLLARSHKAGVQRQALLAAAALSDVILGPAARHLKRRRLLIAADGALQYVPFAALPVKGQAGVLSPLLVDHEVVSLPSISVLSRLRQGQARRRPPPQIVAVIADPVFEPRDPRLGSWKAPRVVLAATSPAGSGSDLERSASEVGTGPVARLPWSRREAEAILDLVPPEQSLRALDFAASRDLVLSRRLRQFRIVHFATHGFLNAEHPELSGLVLSLVDERGRPRDGFLRVQEIPGLDLGADLVVLSACRTALGKEIRGEGLLGMTQAFFQAGVGRVVVSLWNVNDVASAELMSRFYRALLRGRLPPSRALRAAQLAMLREPRWQAPYYWAGFVLQGLP